MITCRSFLNTDPPLLVDLWNNCLTGQRSIRIRSSIILEYFTFAKPYFDPAGFLLALDDDRPVGFVHAGFAPAASGYTLDQATGVIACLAVLPSCRRQGIASRLLSLAENYLKARGASVALAGGMAPNNPFLFGLYGGADSPGFLASDEAARPFLESRGYQMARTRGVFQRTLTAVAPPADPRFAGIRARYDIIAMPFRGAGWWRECVLGPVEAVEYRLRNKSTNETISRIQLWDMDTFSQHGGHSCVGMLGLDTAPAHRRKGCAKYLLSHVLRHLGERSFKIFEVHAALDAPEVQGLLSQLEFQQVETGHVYRKSL